eukprot:g4160.t1
MFLLRKVNKKSVEKLRCTISNRFSTSHHWYEELEQRKQIKSASFYEEGNLNREYFYHVDLQGRLFAEDVIPKNIATSIKSDKFLNFFFRRLRKNDSNRHEDYPYISPCGNEMNFIKASSTPIVFHNFSENENNLIFAADLKVEFKPEQLAMCPHGRLFHRDTKSKVGDYALIRSHVVGSSFADYINFCEESDTFTFKWKGENYELPIIQNK